MKTSPITRIAAKRTPRCLGALFCALIALEQVSLGAANAPVGAPPTSLLTDVEARRSTAFSGALTAFRARNATGAVTSLLTLVNTATNAAPAELQVGEHLGELALWFKNGQDLAAAMFVAQTTVNWSGTYAGKFTARDRSRMLHITAQMQEIVLGNTAQARVSYAAAVAADATNIVAAAALRRLDAVQTESNSKDAGNAVLRLRPVLTPGK